MRIFRAIYLSGIVLPALLAVSCGGGAEPAEIETSPTVLIRGATLIDGTGGSAKANTDILISGEKVQQVGTELAAPKGAEVIDAAGKFVIPGIIDTHVHLDAPTVFQLSPEEKETVVQNTPRAFLYNGVTTVLNLSSDADWIWKQRKDQREGRLVAPRIYAMGRSFTPEGGWGSRHGGALTSPEEARRRALDYVEKGTDGFKIILEDGLGGSGTYKVMPDDILQAIVEVARENNVPLYIHAINLDEFRKAVSVRPRAIVHGLEDPIPDGDPLIQELFDNNIMVVPTLSLFESFTRYDESPQGLGDPILRGSVPGFLLDHMGEEAYRAEESRRFTEVARMDVYPWAREKIPVFRENIRKMHEAGVKLAVGTDAGGPVGYNFQGYNTPWEVKLLTECGLTPMEALVAATRNGAEVIGVAGELGTIEPGKSADLLILTSDPLADISNVRSIESIVLAGKIHRRDEFSAAAPHK